MCDDPSSSGVAPRVPAEAVLGPQRSAPRGVATDVRSGPPIHALWDFAYMGRQRSFADRVARLGEPDCWDELDRLADDEDWNGIASESAGTLRVLKNYIQYTFDRLAEEGKIAVSADERSRRSTLDSRLSTKRPSTVSSPSTALQASNRGTSRGGARKVLRSSSTTSTSYRITPRTRKTLRT